MQGAGGVGGLLELSDTVNGVHFVAYDANGNVTALAKGSDGTISARYEYGPFGELLRCTGPMAKVNPFRFSTKFQDDETDLLHYGYRYYNASTGRWLARDPKKEAGGANLFALVHNSPINRCDPLGLQDYSKRFPLYMEPWNQGSQIPAYAEMTVSVNGTAPYQGVSITFRITRPTDDETKQLWADTIMFGRGVTEYWEGAPGQGWHWPNLAALLNARGPMRYGKPDPGHWGADSAFMGVTVQRERPDAPVLVSGDWLNDNDVTDLKGVSHSAHLGGKFMVWPRSLMGACQGAAADPIRVWLAYCDSWSMDIWNNGWPVEYGGTDYGYIRITWKTDAGGGLVPEFSDPNAKPPYSPMWDRWAEWQAAGAQPRYINVGNY